MARVRSGGAPLWLAFMQAHGAVLDALEEALQAGAGLPLGWQEVLYYLATAPDGRLRMQELAGSVLLSRSGLTRLCDRMEEAGYIQRASCPSDRRGTFAVITPKGRAKFEEATPVFLRGVEERFARHLRPADRKALLEMFTKLIEVNRS